MSSSKNICTVFVVIILLLTGIGISSLFYLITIASDVEQLYRHPYSVSNAIRNINISLTSMDRYMKDVVLAEDEQQIIKATQLINNSEQIALENFDIIFDRYLGKRSDIHQAYLAFIDWKKIRDEVIELKDKGYDKKAADITKSKGDKHVNILYLETQKLFDFADNKSKEFLGDAITKKRNAIAVIVFLLLITITISIFISYYSIRHLNTAQMDMKERMHLIDQNILIARFDLNGVLIDISNALCRYLELTKKEAVSNKANFFLDNDAGTTAPEDILRIASTGTTWTGEICIISGIANKKWIQSVVHPILNNDHEIYGYTNIIKDITDRKLIEKKSKTDALTQLYNRQNFNTILEKEFRTARNSKSFLALAILDVDYFKKYNDHYGHPAGDHVLAQIAKTIKSTLRRSSDYAFRLGGEEFGLIFSDLDASLSLSFLERLRNRIENLKIKHCGNDISEYKGVEEYSN